MPNARRDGSGFDDATVQAVWEKGQPIVGYDANALRADRCGAWIQRTAYGDTNSNRGWEIDHINPVANGGSDSLGNLQPLYWQNNRTKGDKYPWKCE